MAITTKMAVFTTIFMATIMALQTDNEATTRLRSISVYASPDGSNESGSIDLQFNHDYENDSYTLSRIGGWGWGEEYSTDNGSGILPSFLQLNWNQFADIQFANLEAGVLGETYSDIEAYVDNESLAFTYSLSTAFDNQALSQNAVLGDSVLIPASITSISSRNHLTMISGLDQLTSRLISIPSCSRTSLLQTFALTA